MLRKVLPLLAVSSLAILLFLITGCGGKNSPPISVGVRASATEIDGAGTNSVTLTATVKNDSSDKGVTWSAAGGGTLSPASSASGASVTFTPPAAKSSSQSITVTATSAADTSQSGSVTIQVPAALSITNSSANALNGAVGAAYSIQLQGSGGIPPYKNWAVASGYSLPSCLTLSSTGVITFASKSVEAACAAGSPYDPAFTFTDSGTPTPLTGTTPDYDITIAAAPALTLPTPSAAEPGPGTAGAAYSALVAATGGAGTLTYSITSGTLPTGLTLNTSSGAISGTADKAGTHNFTVEVSDGYGDTPASQSYSLVISPAPVVKFALSAPASSIAGSGFALTVTAQDVYSNTVTGYTGTVSFTSTDQGAGVVLPASYTFTAADNGMKTFAGLKLVTAGNQSVTATDANGITGSANIAVSAAGVSKFGVTASTSSPTAGAPFSVTVAAQDPYGNTVTDYVGTVGFTSSDTNLHVVLPSNYAFLAADSGIHTFTNAVTLAKVATNGQWIKAADTLASSINGTVTVNVVPAAASSLVLSNVPGTATAGTPFPFTVTAYDPYNNVATGFSDKVNFTSIDQQASFSANNTTLTSGAGTFSATLKTEGNQTITATDASNASLTATSTITVNATTYTKIVLTAPSSAIAGTAFSVTVTAEDNYGNTYRGYTGKVHFTTSDPNSNSVLPSDYTFTASNNGTYTFTNGVKLLTSGSQTLTVTDNGSFTNTATIAVSPATANKLAFSQQPSNTTAGIAITPIVNVRVLDQYGNLTADTSNVTIAIGTNAGSGTLSGTLTEAAVSGVATFSNLSINKAGTGYTLTAADGSLTGATSSTFNITPAAASQLAFGVQPANTTAGIAIAPAVTVRVLDQFGNLVTADTSSMTIAFGTNAGSGTLSGTLTEAAVSGVATFSNLSINKAGTGYTLTAADGSLTGATSSTFNITPAAASQLAFGVQPTNTTAGIAITPAVTVRVLDQFGNLVTADTSNVTIAFGTNAGSGTLSGTLTEAAVSGVATFSNLSITTAGTGYTLTAADGSLTGATSSAFNITPAAASQLAFGAQPANTTAGIAITPAVTVRVLDQYGNLTADTSNVTIAIGTNPGSGTLSGTLTEAAVSGVATFSDLSITTAGTGYTLTAADGSLTGATSSAFNIAPAAASQLAFGAQPTNTTAGIAITQAVTVRVLDQYGNLTADTSNVTIAIGTNPGSGTLSGTLTEAAVSGVATFSDLSITTAGTGYTLTAADGSLTGATSSAFNITPAAASNLAFTTQPGGGAAGAPWTPEPVVTIEDQYGNAASSSASVTLAIATNPSAGTLTCASDTVSAASGVATFAGCSIDNPGDGYTLSAASGSLTGATSNSFTVGPAVSLSGYFSLPNFCNNGSGTLPVTFTVTATDTSSNSYTAMTDNTGVYSLAGLPYGTYSIVPSVTGAASSVFYPTSYPSVTFSSANPTIGGEAFGAEVGYNISGNVTYTGTQVPGQTYLYLENNNCGNGSGQPGTSISASTLSSDGAFTIQGVGPGDYTLNAWMDADGVTSGNAASLISQAGTGGVYNGAQGMPNANNPTGSTSNVTVSNASLPGQAVSLSDPAFYNTPSSNPGIQVVPAAGGVLIFYNPPSTSGVENANGYLVNWNTDPTLNGSTGMFSHLAGSRAFFATGTGPTLWLLNNTVTGANTFTAGTPYYFQARAFNTLASPDHQAGWSTFEDNSSNPIGVTIPSNNTFCSSNCTTVSATVTIPSSVAINPGAPLYIGFYQQSAGSQSPTAIYAAQVASPVTGDNTVSITIPNGQDYHLLGILDQNDDGQIDAYDSTNVRNGNPNAVAFSGIPASASMTLPSTGVQAFVRTNYSQDGNSNSSYSLDLEIDEANKLPVRVTLYSGANLLDPVDMGICADCGGNISYQYYSNIPGGAPNVGDPYYFTVQYSDGSTDLGSAHTIAGTISAWDSANNGSAVTGPTSLPTNMSPVSGGSTAVEPNFTWTFPPNPGDFYYSFFLSSESCMGNCTIWQIPANNSNSDGFTYAQTETGATTAQITWGTDPTGGGSSPTGDLDPSNTYNWGITVQDSNGNSAQQTVTYQP